MFSLLSGVVTGARWIVSDVLGKEKKSKLRVYKAVKSYLYAVFARSLMGRLGFAVGKRVFPMLRGYA